MPSPAQEPWLPLFGATLLATSALIIRRRIGAS
jgi:LPXTG-motif cell wall-anchored protein